MSLFACTVPIKWIRMVLKINRYLVKSINILLSSTNVWIPFTSVWLLLKMMHYFFFSNNINLTRPLLSGHQNYSFQIQITLIHTSDCFTRNVKYNTKMHVNLSYFKLISSTFKKNYNNNTHWCHQIRFTLQLHNGKKTKIS